MVSDCVSPWPDTAAIEKRHGLCLAGPNCDTCRWLATLDVERAKHAAELALINHDACPCLHTTPCDPDCTCVKPFMSRGCARCCSYGAPEQQRAMAEHLADRDAELATLQAKYDEEERRADGYADQLDRCYLAEGELASLKEANARLEATVSAYGALVGVTLACCEECFARPATRKGDDFGWCDRCTPFDDGAMFDVPNAAAIRAVDAALAPPQPMHMPTCGFELGASHTDRWVCDTRCLRHPLRHVTLAPPQPTGDIIHNTDLSSVTVTAEQAAQLLGKPTGDGQAKP